MRRVGRSGFDLDDIAELAGRVCNATAAVIVHREAGSNDVSIIGRFAFQCDFTNNPPPARVIGTSESLVIYRDVQNDPALRGHQIQTLVPQVKTLIAVQLSPKGAPEQTSLGVHNAPLEFIDDPQKFALFIKLIMMLRGQFENLKDTGLANASHFDMQVAQALSDQGMQDTAAPSVVTYDAAAKFLFDTLQHKQFLHVRNASSYVSLRTWRKAIKEHQVAAMVAAKMYPTAVFVDKIAEEIANSARSLYGANSFKAVIPVPGGSSATQSSLSEKLAEMIATKLSLPYHQILAPQVVAKGKSHPQKSAKLQPYMLREEVHGSVLLIDDVATSGRHIELAQQAIRATGNDCFAMCWIGP